MSDPGKAVFLSYASQDAGAAKRIADALRSSGVEVWFDAEGGLEHGDAWDAKIRRQIKECVLFIPLISANTQAREEGYFRIEWELAAQRALGIATGVAFILPVLIDATKEADALVPDRFRTVQWTKLTGGTVSDDVKQRFLKLWSHRTGVLKHVSEEHVGAERSKEPEVRTNKQEPVAYNRAKPRGLFPAAMIVLAILGLGAGAAFFWRARHEAALKQQREASLAEIQRRVAAQDIGGAFTLTEEALKTAPGDPALQAWWEKVSMAGTLETTPSGAEVSIRVYTKVDSPWRKLGVTPLKGVRLPRAVLRFRIELAGRAPCEIAQAPGQAVRESLEPVDRVPAGMVSVGGRTTNQNATGLEAMKLEDFFIDRFEVTNRQFKEFVDKGGYAEARYWTQPFVKAGRTLAREEAMALLVDGTGKPGPAAWRNGTYPAGMEDFPVTGVSWFEAAAYAAFAGKRLPSIHHWRQAATLDSLESVVPLSNFSGKGLAKGGTYQGMSACGAFDLAGNAKEWCWNSAGPDARYILGGAWRESDYMFTQADAMAPFDRSEANGFRCMQPVGGKPVAAALDADRPPNTRSYAGEQPVNDETFSVIRGLFTYDKTPLDARLEATDDSDARWRKEKVSYRTAYSDERITAYVLLPKNSTPPYQAVVYFPGAGSMTEKSSENLRDINFVAMLVASGRALIYPVYQGTYERSKGERRAIVGTAGHRDWIVMLAKDVQRTVDYLESRPDMQPDKIAYAGLSWGGANGAIMPAIERRIKACVLMIGGFHEVKVQPEVDQINFAPRNTAPTLMLSGRYDFRFPLETSQRPMFKWLGAPPEHKKHVLYDTGHSLKPELIAGEAYPWLDKYLGYVR